MASARERGGGGNFNLFSNGYVPPIKMGSEPRKSLKALSHGK